MNAIKQILIAEDQTDIRDLLALNLRGAGYGVSETRDGPSALALQTEAPFEAKTGLRGEVVFDRFTLVQAPATQETNPP